MFTGYFALGAPVSARKIWPTAKAQLYCTGRSFMSERPSRENMSHEEDADQSNLKLRAVISPKRALIVQSPWASLLVDGEKTVEIRGSATKMFGSIAIAQSKSKLLIGEVTLESCCLIAVRDEDGRLQDVPGSLHTLDSLKDAHRIKDVGSIPYGKVYSW